MEKYKFYSASKDLSPCKESWKSDSFDERSASILKHYENKTGNLPTKNMKYIRGIDIDITRKTTIEEVKSLVEEIHDAYKISCFQISINRSDKVCRILFDFYDKKNCCCYYFNKSDKIHLVVMIIKKLSLAVPSELREHWTSYSIRYDLKKNPHLYDEILEVCKERGFSKHHYQVISSCLKLIKEMYGNYRYRK